MDNIVIPSDFNWESTKEINFKIHSQNSQIISISSSENYNIYSKYYFIGNDTTYFTTINIPSDETYIYINSHKLELANYLETIELNLDTLAPNLTYKTNSKLVNPISIWHFDEGFGTNIEDSEGNNNGTMSQATWVNGISNSALAFNGENSNVIIPFSDDFNLSTGVTIMAWARIYKHKESIIAQNGNGYGIGIGEWSGFNGYIDLTSGERSYINWNSGRPILNEWYHLAMTYNGQDLSLYVNGYLANRKSESGLMNLNNMPFVIGSDYTDKNLFNGVIDEVTVYDSALKAEEILDYYFGESSTDSDGDGVADAEDDYPDDISRSFDSFWPNEINGSILFEDLWPKKGDYDFNDLVIDFRINKVTNAQNNIVELKFNFLLKAIGSGISNGFGFQINNEISKEDLTVQGIELVADYIYLEANGLESNQEKPVVIVFDDANKIMESPTGFGVNVELDKPYVEPVEFEITISLPENKYSSTQFSSDDFNPFIIINKQRSKEVHLSNFPPTSLADKSIFGTSDDNSNEGVDNYYKSKDNLPWAILVPMGIKQPLEGVQITSAYLNFYEWASSEGNYFTDWFRNNPTNIDETKVYNPPSEEFNK